MTASPSQHDHRWMVRAFYSDGSTALYPHGTYKRAARANARGILNAAESRFVHSATAGRSEVVATAVVDSWDDDYAPKDADVFLDRESEHGADASYFQRVPHVQFAPAEALATALRNAAKRPEESRFVPTGYGIDPDDGSTTLGRAETARRTVKVNPSKVPLTSPENAGERRALGAWIAERAGDDYVTTTEAAHVVQWCRDWIAELEDATPFEDAEDITDADALAFTQRYCEGGVRFVLDDVRRCRDTLAAVAGLEAHTLDAEDDDMPSAADIAEAEASLDGTPYTVAKTYNAGEDGMLWQVLRDGVPVPDAGGSYMREGAVLEAADLAALDKLTDAEREAVSELRSRTPDGRYALAVIDAGGLVEIREADADADPAEILSRARADYAGTLARVVDVNGSVSLVDADAEDAEIRRAEESRIRELVTRAENGDADATEALFELVRDDDEFAPFAQAEAERQRRERAALAAKRERWQTERLLAEIRNTLPEDKHARTLREAERIADAAAVPFYTRDGAPMTAQQRATVAKLREECERGWCVPVLVTTARYGSGSDVLAIVHAEGSPAPDPVTALWLDGNAHAIGSEDDWTRWHDILAERATHAAVQRADDMCVVIAVGGSFAPLP